MKSGTLIKNKRMECGLSQVELAKRMKMSQKTISSWETGRTIPRIKDIVEMSHIFGCSIADLTGGRGLEAGEITLEDILIKLSDLTTYELTELHKRVDALLKSRTEIERIEEELKRSKERIAQYERQIEKIRKGADL